MIQVFFSSLLLVFFFLDGFSQVDVTKIEEYVESSRMDWNIPGMALVIVKDGDIISCRGYGLINADEDRKVDENTLFAIASNTKAFISSSFGVLQDQRKLSLDDKVQKYIPEFQLYDNYASSEANIADLLSHRLGLGTYSGDVIWYKTNYSAQQVIKKTRFVPQTYSFRAGYGYSNLMFIAAGEVIGKVSGKSWDQFVSETFFTPLGMNRTITSIDDLESKGNYATPHKPVGEKSIPIDWVNWDNMGAAGGIISSANDMAKWLIFQLDRGIWENDTILNPKTQNTLWTPHNNFVVNNVDTQADRGTNFAGYGLGWRISDYFGNRMITHGGGYDGMYSQVAIFPEIDLGIVILTNSMKSIATPLRYYIVNAFIEKEKKDWSAEALKHSRQKSRVQKLIESIKDARKINTNPRLDNSAYVGSYSSDMVGRISILENNGKLNLKFDHAPDLSAELIHWHYDTWEIRWDQMHAWFDFGLINFNVDSELSVTGFEFDVPNYDIFFHELKVKKEH